tara:strand:- start:47994 stop:48740 length:747 start_codon:yes stop_codon:yes gene_type:complete
VIIENKFRGPPSSGNGGYVSGIFARLIKDTTATEVTLRAPIPLDHLLTAVPPDNDVARVVDGETLIAEVRAAELSLDIPEPVDWDLVRGAEPLSYSFAENIHPQSSQQTSQQTLKVRGFHPICFCCGADHEDGLQVFAAPLDEGRVAAIWRTKQEWAAEDGKLRAEYLWTAMDCPGQFAFMSAGIKTGLLGRMTGRIHARPVAGEDLLVTAWTVRVEGKKHFAGSAIHTKDNKLCGEAMTVWIGRREM